MSVPGTDSEPIPANIRALLTPAAADAVRATILDNNPGMSQEIAGRVLDEALKFVAACATNHDQYLQPSRAVDEGWHALILHTTVYAALCDRLGGFVHHFPERPDPSRHNPEVMDNTVALIAQAGYTPDGDLWGAPGRELVTVAANCVHSPCGGPIDPEKVCANKPRD
ncbi:hypothetical protein ABZ832_09260 [Streptantibioticus parmotrematis]|uniref:glycine-rich domain-containing protein n=1 Tax=Streptantibioticus parmotrematis TaxID=2873249 RepID=UPI0033EA1AB6